MGNTEEINSMNIEKEKIKKSIILTDLDGTLLDHETYSFEKAKPALEKTQSAETPVVFVTSKTFAEVQPIQKKMGLWGKEPFIVENGGAILIPKKFTDLNLKDLPLDGTLLDEKEFWRLEFGKPYEIVRDILKEAAAEVGVEVRGIGDMSAEEFAKDSGLSVEEAELAKKRMYQEGFKILTPEINRAEIAEKLKKAIIFRGYHMSAGGRYYQIMGSPAKIRAVTALKELFRIKYGNILCIGFGDAPADLEFLELCDEGYLLANPKKAVAVDLTNKKNIKKIPEIGPEGWNKVVMEKLG